MLIQIIIMNDDTFVHTICLALTTGLLAILTTIIISNYSSAFKKDDILGKEVTISN